MDPLTISAISAGISYAGSAISNLIQRRQLQRQKKQINEAFESAKLSKSEMEDRALEAKRQAAMPLIGTTTISGLLNPEALAALQYTALAGQQNQAYLQSINMDRQYNMNLETAKARALANMPAAPSIFDSVISGLPEAADAAMQGYYAGKQLNMQEELNEKIKSFYDLAKSYYDQLYKNVLPKTDDEIIPQPATTFETSKRIKERQNALIEEMSSIASRNVINSNLGAKYLNMNFFENDVYYDKDYEFSLFPKYGIYKKKYGWNLLTK